jgi:RNA polymerase sigma-70 factor (ECF subfamily)
MRVQTHRSFAESVDLIQRARAGDSGAFETLLARYSDRLLNRVRLMMGEEARREAESVDFLQATLLQVVRHFERAAVADERAFLRWLTSVARNRIRDSVRRRREVPFAELSRTLSTDRPSPQQASPPSQAASNEEVDRLAEALEELDPELRRAVELRDFDGLAFAAVGERLGCNEEHARWLHRKALVRLSAHMLPS